jgi:hypothetical protein
MDANAADGVIWPQEGSLLVVDEQPSYQVGRLIHQAESALIHAASNECGQPLVLKIYRPQPMQGESPEVQWQQEQQKLGLLNHPQVLRLHAIHARGIVHLDVSPLNVLVQPPGLGEASPRFKIADFGISVLLREGVELSRPPEPWAHLPPELLQPGSRSPTPRCDLYGLGLTLMLALTGSLPLINALPLATVEHQVLQGLPSQQASQLRQPLGRFIATLLQVHPEARYGSALEAWRALKDLD